MPLRNHFNPLDSRSHLRYQHFLSTGASKQATTRDLQHHPSIRRGKQHSCYVRQGKLTEYMANPHIGIRINHNRL